MTSENQMQGNEAVNDGAVTLTIFSWLFGVIAAAIGFVNTFWGNDPGFGIFILVLSLVYFVPVNDILKRMAGVTIPRIGLLKFLLGLFIIWAAMGVGELFDKVELMMHEL